MSGDQDRGRHMTKRIGFFAGAVGIAMTLLLGWSARADMGRIYVSTKAVEVGESAQNALILQNGKEEILVLGTQIHASARVPIIRFIPFPSEPDVRLAPKGIFGRLATLTKKYGLQYVYVFQSKGPPEPPRMEGVEVRFAARLGAHDVTVVKVTKVGVFRRWVNDYFRSHKLPLRASYPRIEAIVADYVARGFVYFVLDSVDVGDDGSYVAPIAYRFKSASLYYPLMTSNSFGGKGEIDLFLMSPKTLCVPGSGTNLVAEAGDRAADAAGHQLENQCLGISVKASTSSELVPQEHDLRTLYPAAAGFFGNSPVFLQSVRYVGDYKFDNDILVDMRQGTPQALGAPRSDDWGAHFGERLTGEQRAICRQKPDRGPCKGLFRGYYFDPASHRCQAFVWGGCQGSVPFHTLEDCQRTCGVGPSK